MLTNCEACNCFAFFDGWEVFPVVHDHLGLYGGGLLTRVIIATGSRLEGALRARQASSLLGRRSKVASSACMKKNVLLMSGEISSDGHDQFLLQHVDYAVPC